MMFLSIFPLEHSIWVQPVLAIAIAILGLLKFERTNKEEKKTKKDIVRIATIIILLIGTCAYSIKSNQDQKIEEAIVLERELHIESLTRRIDDNVIHLEDLAECITLQNVDIANANEIISNSNKNISSNLNVAIERIEASHKLLDSEYLVDLEMVADVPQNFIKEYKTRRVIYNEIKKHFSAHFDVFSLSIGFVGDNGEKYQLIGTSELEVETRKNYIVLSNPSIGLLSEEFELVNLSFKNISVKPQSPEHVTSLVNLIGKDYYVSGGYYDGCEGNLSVRIKKMTITTSKGFPCDLFPIFEEEIHNICEFSSQGIVPLKNCW